MFPAHIQNYLAENQSNRAGNPCKDPIVIVTLIILLLLVLLLLHKYLSRVGIWGCKANAVPLIKKEASGDDLP